MSSLLMATRAGVNKARLSSRLACARSSFSSSAGGNRGWKNETPQGSATEVFVYSPDTDITWPDEKLGVLGATDPKFQLPGYTGLNISGEFPEQDPKRKFPYSSQHSFFTAPSKKETQVHALYNANDYIKYTPGSESVVCADLLDEFPRIVEMDEVEIVAHETPLLLRKEMKALFPGQNLDSGPFTTVTYSIQTENDMSKWSDEIEAEREEKMETFVQVAKEICARLKEEGFWADFIDPCSGTPYFSGHTNTTMFETDEKFRALGFRIEDLGCCKVIHHPHFGRNVFVGCIVTNAGKNSVVLEDIFEDLLL